ncbi:hypothetical protein [Streptomyces bohaiensis]|uniref:Uncharacterized protein n=1 Tax=Streptomyces bohaiensis TaxID=1431344 RepID=A0ABX1C7R6_9ACTN|nr:hypothetical protein [Streptomyces bohaiensis]NJQ15211.1 hypothetical protein [Streptomyces bohaiensis]
MSEAGHDPAATGGGTRRFHRPAALFTEPAAPPREDEPFFSLETVTDPAELLGRATELAEAFRGAADRATEFQAVAAAQLADPRRFDRLSVADIAGRAGWTEEYAERMVQFGRELESRPPEE